MKDIIEDEAIKASDVKIASEFLCECFVCFYLECGFYYDSPKASRPCGIYSASRVVVMLVNMIT